MKVRKLEGPPYEKLQCELPQGELAPNALGYKGYRERRSERNGRDPSCCMRNAMWEVDGQKLCTQHAGQKALEHLST
jgi:hypothetical protein